MSAYADEMDRMVRMARYGVCAPPDAGMNEVDSMELQRDVAKPADSVRQPSILDEARAIIYGDREETHGTPDKNLRAIGHIWTAILADKLQDGCAIGPELVCLMMAGLKLARAANKPQHREHALDTVGYMALMERCGFLAQP
jgi:hypothetical protein